MTDELNVAVGIDLSNDFASKDMYPDAKLPVKYFSQIVDSVNEAIRYCHKHGIPFYFSNDAHEKGDEEFDDYGEHCLIGSKGARINSSICYDRVIDRFFHKDTFNAFDDQRLVMEMEWLMDKKNANELNIYLGGVVTPICIKETALGARELGYNPIVIEECVSGSEYREEGLDELREMGMDIVDVYQFKDAVDNSIWPHVSDYSGRQPGYARDVA